MEKMNLDSNRIEVMEFLKRNFNLDEVTLQQYDLYPGGVILTDKNNGKLLFYHDLISNQIKWIDEF